jgi:hypothetical protein
MKIKIALIAGFLWFLSSSSASACRGPFPPFEQNLSRSKTIFVGRIVSVNQIQEEGGEKIFETTFKVERIWKGKVGKTITLVSTNNSCDFSSGASRMIGEKWLILAGEATPKIGSSVVSGNVMLEMSNGKPTGKKMPTLVNKKLGRGHAP